MLNYFALQSYKGEVMRQYIPMITAVDVGLLIAYVDSRPNWDDTGITAGAVFLGAAIFAAIDPRRPWRWALAVGLWIPLWAIVATRNYGSLLALAVAFAGVSIGYLFRQAVLART
jgi:hypothetical protein